MNLNSLQLSNLKEEIKKNMSAKTSMRVVRKQILADCLIFTRKKTKEMHEWLLEHLEIAKMDGENV